MRQPPPHPSTITAPHAVAGRPGWWPLPVLLALFIGITAWSVYRAVIGVSAVTDPQYYSHGLRYQDTLLERRAAASRGWRLEATLANNRLIVELQDQKRAPVADADCVLLAQTDGRPMRLSLAETAKGRYETPLPPGLAPSLQASLDCRARGAAVHRLLLINR